MFGGGELMESGNCVPESSVYFVLFKFLIDYFPCPVFISPVGPEHGVGMQIRIRI